MNYTLREGVDDRPEKIRNYMFKGLPILIASMIAVVGAFNQANNSSGDSNNQEPLAIYTAPSSDFGSPSNPQNNGGDPQSSGSNGNTNQSSPQEESRISGSQTSTAGNSPPAPSATLTQPALPVGGYGGGSEEDDSCLCEQITNPTLPPIITPPLSTEPIDTSTSPLPSTEGIL